MPVDPAASQDIFTRLPTGTSSRTVRGAVGRATRRRIDDKLRERAEYFRFLLHYVLTVPKDTPMTKRTQRTYGKGGVVVAKPATEKKHDKRIAPALSYPDIWALIDLPWERSLLDAGYLPQGL